MPTFSAVALDRLLEPGASKSVDKSVPSSNHLPNPKPVTNSNLERKKSISTTERRSIRPQISPALYATPEATPLPDSPSSFPPSPYIINHKRRGPRLLKSFSEVDVASRTKTSEKYKANVNAMNGETNVVALPRSSSFTFVIPKPVEEEEEHVNDVHICRIKKEFANGVHDSPIKKEFANGVHDGGIMGTDNREFGSSNKRNGLASEKDVQNLAMLTSEREGEADDFFDPQDSMSYTSNTDGDDVTGTESSVKFAAATPNTEFFDAWEELSSGSGTICLRDMETELREMRLSFLMEIEKRKQAEEAINHMRSHWERIRQQLADAGLTLPASPIPASPIDVAENEQLLDIDPAEELLQQVYLARFVSNSIGRGFAKAEMEMEMEAQIEVKNNEIARLLDRLHYYEAVNREMSQRNQEAIEMARRERQVKKRRERWLWGSITATITLGAAALAWSYFPAAKGSTSDDSFAPAHDDATKR